MKWPHVNYYFLHCGQMLHMLTWTSAAFTQLELTYFFFALTETVKCWAGPQMKTEMMAEDTLL